MSIDDVDAHDFSTFRCAALLFASDGCCCRSLDTDVDGATKSTPKNAAAPRKQKPTQTRRRKHDGVGDGLGEVTGDGTTPLDNNHLRISVSHVPTREELLKAEADRKNEEASRKMDEVMW
jgi:hypothetical protein